MAAAVTAVAGSARASRGERDYRKPAVRLATGVGLSDREELTGVEGGHPGDGICTICEICILSLLELSCQKKIKNY